jgi:hypothetical protein
MIPAITSVAEWSSALTGVGPSIASGSHMYDMTEILFTASDNRIKSSSNGSVVHDNATAVVLFMKMIAKKTSAIRFVPTAMWLPRVALIRSI